jgi:poly(hydroxyalkanoate) granule associated protein phasin
MMKQTTVNFPPLPFGEEALAASRKVWLASLGAAAVTRDWVQTEATKTFKTLVKEGTVVESRAVAFVGDRIETSMGHANRLWKQTRTTVESTVKQAADAAVTLANSALPKSLPKIELPYAAKPAKARPAKAAKKTVRKSATKVVRKAKRSAKAA